MRIARTILLFSVLLTWWPSACSAVGQQVIVTLLDQTQVPGKLIEITHQAITIDPAGRDAMRVIPAEAIASAYFLAEEITLYFPLSPEDIPEEILHPDAQPEQSSSGYNGEGFRDFSAHLAGGLVSPSASKEFLKGNSTGTQLQFDLHYNFHGADRYARQLFLVLSYQRGNLAAGDPVFLRVDAGGNEIYAVYGDMSMQILTAGLGATTRNFGGNTFAYGFFAFGFTSTTSEVQREYRSKGGAIVDRDAAVQFDKSYWTAQLKVGGVLELSPTLGFELNTLLSYLSAGDSDQTSSDPVAETKGILWGLAIGLCLKL